MSGGVTPDPALHGLTPDQREAVTHLGSPLMIVAGAGTGKTHVLASRIVWLVSTGQAKPEEILALTFTDRASGEMSDRLDRALPQGQRGVEVGTFHALCDRLLRRHALEMGLDADFFVLSSAQAKLLLRESLFALPLDRYRPRQDPLSYLSALIRHFDKAKNEAVRPAAYLAWTEALRERIEADPDSAGPGDWDRYERQRELARCYDVYQGLLESAGYLDFGDQLVRCLDLLDASPHLLASLRKGIKFLLVDEFQDTNRTQFELIKRLAGGGEGLTVVGDDDQAIYSFRGASLANVLEFEEAFPGTKRVVLRDNFRSTQQILDLAYRGICHNNPHRLEVRHGLDKSLRAARPPQDGKTGVEVRTFATLTDEAEAVATRIEELMATAAIDYGDCAILVRNNRDANAFLPALEARSIPFRFQGSHGLYERPEIRLLLSLARTLSDPLDSQSCHHLAASRLFSLGTMKLLTLNAYARRQNVSLYQAMLDHRQSSPEGGVPFEAAERSGLGGFLALLESLAERVLELAPRALLHAFLVESGWMGRLTASTTEAGMMAQARNLARFFDIVRAHEALFPEHRLPQFVEHLDLLREAGDSPGTVESEGAASAVSVLTVHGSKGLEFPVVFLVGLTAGRFPSWRREDPLEFPADLMAYPSSSPDEDHVSEERRVFHVAVTRAKSLLWMSMAYDEGRRRSQQVSRFVREAMGETTPDLRPQKRSPLERLQRHAAPTTAMEQDLSMGTLGADRPLRLSSSKLELYLSCPRKYFYQEVLQLAAPTSHQASYGQALHEAVTAILTLKQQGVRASLEEVQEAFRTRWNRAGFLSSEHSDNDLSQGLTAIAGFWEAEAARPVPRFVERDFRVHLGDNNWLFGRWDRVDLDGEVWSVTDYKTSQVVDQEHAQGKARDSRQLVLYAIALEHTVGARPEWVALDFLGSGLSGRTTVGDRDVVRVSAEIARAARGMRGREYGATPNFSVCKACAFRTYCAESAYT